jgi:hypothetical protein
MMFGYVEKKFNKKKFIGMKNKKKKFGPGEKYHDEKKFSDHHVVTGLVVGTWSWCVIKKFFLIGYPYPKILVPGEVKV